MPDPTPVHMGPAPEPEPSTAPTAAATVAVAAPPRSAPREIEPLEPLQPHALQAMLRAPHRIPDAVLGPPARLAASIPHAASRPPLAAVLVLGTVLFALPYGLVLGPLGAWRVPVLLLGTLMICFPSLHVFGTYIGRRITLAENVTLALVIPCVAAVFTFGFFPIVWFLQATMRADALVTGDHLSTLLLTVSVLAGVGQLWRCAAADQRLDPTGLVLVVLVLWHVLFLYIGRRLAEVLGLW